MMISCKKAAELVCQALDCPLTWRERIALELHLFMCRSCKGFRKQNEALLELFEERFHDKAPDPGRLPDHACERLKERLRSAMAEEDSAEPAREPDPDHRES